MRKDKNISNRCIELKSDDVKLIPVVVNGEKLPLMIGSCIDLGDGTIRVVTKVQVSEDRKVMYGVQWIDSIDFKLEWMTYDELCYMSNCLKDKPKISL